MNQAITNKEFPTQNAWILGSLLLGSAVSIPFIVVYSFSDGVWVFLFWAIFLCVYGVYFILSVRNFSFSYEEKYIHVKQGVINRQERFLPYHTVQHVSINQGIFERIFGLFNVLIENASDAGGAQREKQQKKSRYHIIGFSGNQLLIPGLRKDHAEILRDLLLEKVKKHAELTKSGL